MFYFPGCAPQFKIEITKDYLVGFPHSETSGSKAAQRLPEIQCYALSFIAFSSQGIHHTPLLSLLGNVRTTYFKYFHSVT